MIKGSIDSHRAISLYLDIDDENHEKDITPVVQGEFPEKRRGKKTETVMFLLQ